MSRTFTNGEVDLKFKKELYPYEANMKKFEEDYKFTFNDGKKSTPKFCLYNGEPHVYLDDFIMSYMCKTKKEKQALIDYVKKNFDEGWDKPEEPEIEIAIPVLKRTQTVDEIAAGVKNIAVEA